MPRGLKTSQGTTNKNSLPARLVEELIARRKTSFLPDGAYVFQDELDVKGKIAAKVIICTAWLLEVHELKAGKISFVSGSTQILPRTKCFGVLYPPFTMSSLFIEDVTSSLVGVASTEPLPSSFNGLPTVFETDCGEVPTSVAQVLEIIRRGRDAQIVDFNPNASLLSKNAKRLIDENFLSYPSIARIAQRLGVSPEHLSRQFKRDFQITPSAYLHQLRLADARLRLARGEPIVNVSLDVGYNDLSRFYKQFRKNSKTSPGACQTLMKPRRG